MKNKGLKVICLLLSYVLVAVVAVGATMWLTLDKPVGSDKLSQLENQAIQTVIIMTI